MIPLSEQFRQALQELKQHAADRHLAHASCEENYVKRREALETSLREATQKLAQSLAQQQAAILQNIEEERRRIQAEYLESFQQTETEFRQVKDQARRNFYTNRGAAEAQFKDARWTVLTLFEADKKVTKDQLQTSVRKLRSNRAQFKEQVREARNLIRSWTFSAGLDVELNRAPDVSKEEPWHALQQRTLRASNCLAQLRTLPLPQILKGRLVLLAVLLFWLAFWIPALFIPPWYLWPLLSTAVILPTGWLVHFLMQKRARTQVAFLWQNLAQAALDAKPLRRLCLIQARHFFKVERQRSREKHQASFRQAASRFRQQLQDLTKVRRGEYRAANRTYPPILEELSQKREDDAQANEVRGERLLARAQQIHDQELENLESQHQQLSEELERRHAALWNKISDDWQNTVGSFEATARRVDQQCRRWFPPWQELAENWEPPTELPLGLPLGQLEIITERIRFSEPEDERMARLNLEPFHFPALLPFPDRAAVLLQATEQGRDSGVKALEALLLRAWTSLPPGKVRCTIIDPVGRGENFAAFMHLADHDEALITSRIWTEPNHIEQRLADLTSHMETVLQKFLRNQYQTLAEYNAHAGEVAEPFRFLVVAHFPVNFSTEAARRLISLASAGARCGIYPLILADSKQPLPQGIEMADIEDACITFHWREGRFVWRDAEFFDYPLMLDAPPAAEICTSILSVVGDKAKQANRVEVPFETIAPGPDEIWAGDSSSAIAVPLGRAGATGRQLLTLGRGTSQHVLIAGKTGSGKSTLLHVLISQLALRYSPHEVELYLIDFKKGVEFKTYASHELPHARVVAVESEREFGLSVLQRLDGELVRRGELFRAAGVNDLPSYRKQRSNGDAFKLPRVLLIVDEFQEFFVEDDKVAQEAALLLDRLVRQGRAFGIHAILGSQTLGGAYSLARSTIDQMAIRIALQCSETDAHLILSKDNSEARLLSRPGEAIYNAANGLLEGNNLFQTVWLADTRRDTLIELAAIRARKEDYRPPQPMLVFEGTAPSDLAKNPLLGMYLDGKQPKLSGWHAWLGEAVAIKDPTAAVFRKQSGANLMILGQNRDLALRIMVSSLVSLTCQISNSLPLVVGSAPEGESEAFLHKLPEAMPLRLVTPREVPELMQSLTQELERRQQGGEGPPLFLPLFGLHRLRDLRKPEDDFGFNRNKDEPPSPAKQLQTLLREGPPLGIFTLFWCDSGANLQRFLDRQGLREIEMRVLLQMSAADASAMTDSPLASRLGPYRALYYTEDQGKMEKFRPYGLPDPAWLERLFKTIESRD